MVKKMHPDIGRPVWKKNPHDRLSCKGIFYEKYEDYGECAYCGKGLGKKPIDNCATCGTSEYYFVGMQSFKREKRLTKEEALNTCKEDIRKPVWNREGGMQNDEYERYGDCACCNRLLREDIMRDCPICGSSEYYIQDGLKVKRGTPQDSEVGMQCKRCNKTLCEQTYKYCPFCNPRYF